MKPATNAPGFIRSLMAGFFSGIITAAANFLFVFIYRSSTGVNSYGYVISPVFMFVGFPILLALCGMLFFGFSNYLKRGRGFTILFIVLTLLAVILCMIDSALTIGAKGLLCGIEIITGLLIAFLLPYLANHPTLFMTREGIKESEPS